MEEHQEAIQKALEQLGIKGIVQLYRNDVATIKVMVDGAYFGLYDMNKQTFVD